ncbi:MAG: VPLPA-CTERM sorting domain-containing protein [Gammaproteobacteria bacterium]|nr:VPLPA-CTERM sorting domain-containing protein [Gammaproteobacteria bacterium]
MNKSIIAGAIALALGTVATSASAVVISVTGMNFPGLSAASGVADTSTMGTTFGGTFFSQPWTATTLVAYTTTAPNTWAGTSPQGAYSYNFTMTAGQVAFGTYFDWSGNNGIPVLAIFNADGSAGPGVPMQTPPFPGQAPSFQGTVAVPVPAAVWLFGSGMLGLVGIARRRKAA